MTTIVAGGDTVGDHCLLVEGTEVIAARVGADTIEILATTQTGLPETPSTKTGQRARDVVAAYHEAADTDRSLHVLIERTQIAFEEVSLCA